MGTQADLAIPGVGHRGPIAAAAGGACALVGLAEAGGVVVDSGAADGAAVVFAVEHHQCLRAENTMRILEDSLC